MKNPLLRVAELGQSLWLDSIRRSLITSGELQRLIEEDGLRGVTSNPSIFQKALAGSDDYDEPLRELARDPALDAKGLYERLAVDDVRQVADLLRPVYERTGGDDGYVSLEVSPYLATDTDGTVAEARRLFEAVGRPNVMIKVPGTPEGMPAVTELVAGGIPVNVTLLFALDAYEAAAEAWMTGLERRIERGGDLRDVASVASFFISRIDTEVDRRLEQALDATRDAQRRRLLKGLVGQIAIANARVAYGRFLELRRTPRWQRLESRGARVQRLLWASTSTKNPKYPPTMYVDALLGPDTVNTLPEATLRAYRKHGRPKARLAGPDGAALREAAERLAQLARCGVALDEVTAKLLEAGVRSFADSFDTLLAEVETKRRRLLAGEVATQQLDIGEAEPAYTTELEAWRVAGNVRRLWNGDARLWTGQDEDRWLGWLDIVECQREHAETLQAYAASLRDEGFEHVLLLGMGGSSLCPEVLARTFGRLDGAPALSILDSTVPGQVLDAARRIDLTRTLFVVASKSGSTTEPNAFMEYFLARLRERVGPDEVGRRFVAITDPGSSLHQRAKQERFRWILHGVPSIGGRYSALSNFGMAPAAFMGLDIGAFLDSAEIMVHSCAAPVPPAANPGVALGVALGVLARAGRDKITFVASPGLAALGSWLEQLIAESSGKQDKGLIPVDGEVLGPPEAYGDDRVFVVLQRGDEAPAASAASLEALTAAGHPLIRITVPEAMDLGQEFFRWEMATASACAVLGVNAFDQPDVEASKVATRRLTQAYETSGHLPEEAPFVHADDFELYTDDRNARVLRSTAHGESAAAILAAHLRRLEPGDYFAINAYVPMLAPYLEPLQAMRHAVRDRLHVATTLGFGPRFLHSTGQLHKGGPNRGVFLQITSTPSEDVEVPGRAWSFGVLARFQAQGDLEVLCERGRRVLRVHLGPDLPGGLQALQRTLAAALDDVS